MKLAKNLKPLFPYILSFAGGGILPLALAPFNYELFAFLSPAILLFCFAKASAKQSFILGLCFGLGIFGFGTSWVYVSIHDYGSTSVPLAIFITALLTLILALFPALMSYILIKLFPRNNVQRSILAFPVIWVLFDIFRGWLFTGLPWLYVGYSQLSTHLSAFAPLGGVWLVSWATVFTASLFYVFFDAIYENKHNTKIKIAIFVLLITLWGTAFYSDKNFNWTYPKGEALNVSLIQGNIPQLLRWDPNEVSNIIQKYEDLTMRDLESSVKPDLIIWPEAAVPLPMPHSNDLFSKMDATLKKQQLALIAGVPVESKDPKTQSIAYYNSLISIGTGSGLYFKQHLVPFGEYVPFDKQLRGLIALFNLPMSSFISASAKQAPLFLKNIAIAPAICYEIAYPNLVRETVRRGGDIIVTVSNDTWFGRSIGPAQHLEIAQFRALETGRYVLRATNTGFTAVISPKGQVQSLAPQFETYVLKDRIWAMNYQTPWLEYGMWPLLTGFGVLLLFAFIPLKRKK